MTKLLSDPFAWLTALTAGIALWIAYQQVQTARAKLRFDLYERRFRVFDGVTALLAAFDLDADIKNQDLQKFWTTTNEATFLFGEDVMAYLKELRTKAGELWMLNAKLDDSILPVGPERDKVAQDMDRTIEWFERQVEESRQYFTKYLDFRRVL